MRVTSPVSRAVPGGEKIQSVQCENGRKENASTYSLKTIIPVEMRIYNLCDGQFHANFWILHASRLHIFHHRQFNGGRRLFNASIGRIDDSQDRSANSRSNLPTFNIGADLARCRRRECLLVLRNRWYSCHVLRAIQTARNCRTVSHCSRVIENDNMVSDRRTTGAARLDPQGITRPSRPAHTVHLARSMRCCCLVIADPGHSSAAMVAR